MSLHALSLVSTVAFGLVALAAAAAILWSSELVWRSVTTAETLTERITTTAEVEGTVRELHRLGNLYQATDDPDVAETGKIVAAKLRSLLPRLDDEPRAPLRMADVMRMDHDIQAYLSDRDALSQRTTSFAEYQRALRGPLERALASVARVRAQDAAALAHARRRAWDAVRLQRAAIIASVLVLAVGLVAMNLSARWLVIRPVSDLSSAISGFRRGETDVWVPPAGVTEIGELTNAFNEMADMLLEQRKRQVTFLAGVAHDLRNPLAVIKVGLETLAVDPTGDTPQRIARIDRQVDTLARMVGDLLDSAQIEAGELTLEREEVDLVTIARTVVDCYAPTTAAHQLELHAAAEPVVVHGDPVRLEQVLGNLVSNAIRYSPTGGRVDVSVRAEDRWAVVSVKDEGLGIPAAEIPSLFLPFRRRKLGGDAIPGVGLGLSVGRRIVDAHGGRIEVESRPGRGSTFRVRLPFSHPTRESDAEVTGEMPSSGGGT